MTLASPGVPETESFLRRQDIPAYSELKVFTGNAHPELADDICAYLDIPLGKSQVFEFSNENTFVRILENVRERDVFIVQPSSTPVNTSIMELLIMIDAMRRASAGRITAVVPFYGYSRTDKKDQPRVPITAKLIADLITTAGANRLLTMDLHAGQIQGFFNIPVDELTALYLQSDYFKRLGVKNLIVVATDVGIAKRARNFAASLDLPLAILEKRRAGNSEEIQEVNVIGDVDGMNAIIFDDEVDTAGSLISAIDALKAHGARDLYACATHAVLSGPAVERISVSELKRLIVTDTVPRKNGSLRGKLDVLSVASIFGEAIQRIHTGSSIGEMFR